MSRITTYNQLMSRIIPVVFSHFYTQLYPYDLAACLQCFSTPFSFNVTFDNPSNQLSTIPITSTREIFVPWMKDNWQYLKYFHYTGLSVLLAGSGEMSRVLLNIPQCTGQCHCAQNCPAPNFSISQVEKPRYTWGRVHDLPMIFLGFHPYPHRINDFTLIITWEWKRILGHLIIVPNSNAYKVPNLLNYWVYHENLKTQSYWKREFKSEIFFLHTFISPSK